MTIWLVAVLVLAGCAEMKPTPVQERVYAAWEKCRTPTYQLTRVNPDGSFRIEGQGNERQIVVACMEQYGYRFR